MRHALTDDYRRGRERLIGLGLGLDDAQATIISRACPAWSVKDLYAHLAGISADILVGNTADAATEPWADAHVTGRADLTLDEILGQWAQDGAKVSELMEGAGEAFPFQLFMDQWTHEWDIRAALGSMAASTPDTTVFDHYFDDLAQVMVDDDDAVGLDRLTVDVDGRSFDVGTEAPLGPLPLSMFDFARIAMGRRSQAQLESLDWPMVDIAGHVDVLVRWSVATGDVIDPVI